MVKLSDMKRTFLIAAVALNCGFSFGQDVYNLERTIDSAIQRSLTIKNQELEISIAENNQVQTKYAFLPNLNQYMTHGYNWGQSIDPFTNQFASSRVRTNRFALSSDLDLFNGLYRYFDLQGSKLSIDQAKLQLEVRKKSIIQEVSRSYLQLLMTQEEIKIDSLGLELFEKQLEIIKDRILAEDATGIDTIAVFSKMFLYEKNILAGKTEAERLTIALKRQLQLSDEVEIQFADELINLGLEVTGDNLVALKELEEAQMAIAQERLYLDKIKSKYYPNLYFNFTLGTGYSGNSLYSAPDGSLQATPFVNQLDQNFYQSMTFNLKIPIFNRFEVRTETRNQKIRIEQVENDLLTLQSDVEQEYFRLKNQWNSNQTQLEISEKAEALAKLQLDVENDRFEAGVTGFYRLAEIQNEYLKRKSEYNKSKYEYYLSRLLLAVFLEEETIKQ
jgi:outer membrane protein